jgi:hypothetical protein
MLKKDDRRSYAGVFALALAGFLSLRVPVGADQQVELPFWRDVAESNAAAWSAILSIDVEYETTVRVVEKGQVLSERTSSGHRWVRSPNRQRLLLLDLDGQGRVVDRLITTDREYRLEYPVTLSLTDQPLQLCDDRPVRATILTPPPGLIEDLVPQNLELLYFIKAAPRMTRRELLVGREPQRLTPPPAADNNLLTFRVDLMTGDAASDTGSYALLTVDARKGFLIQKAEIVEAAAAHSARDGTPVPIRTTWEVHEWAHPEAGLWYPTQVTFANHGRADVPLSEDGYFIQWTITKLLINQPNPDEEWLGFAFPENAVVQEHLAGGEAGRIFVWGPANLPQAEFETEADYEVFRRAVCNDASTARHAGGAADTVDSEPPAASWRSAVIVNLALLLFLVVGWRLRRRLHQR